MAVGLVAIEENALLRLGLAGATATSGDIELLGEAGNAEDAARVVAETGPDVVTVGLWLPDSDGISTALRLRRYLPDLGVVLLTAVSADALLFRAMDSGLSAYVTKSSPVPTILEAIRHAAVAPHSFTAPGLSSAVHRQHSHSGLLSNRERQVLSLMRDGANTPEIADQLGVSQATVKTYTARIYSKLRVRNRAQALMVALSQGLIEQSLTEQGTGEHGRSEDGLIERGLTGRDLIDRDLLEPGRLRAGRDLAGALAAA